MNEPEFGLVMPFVCVASKGGPYDDDAFVAGWRLGEFDTRLKIANATGMSRFSLLCREAECEQADLIAMQHGFVTVHRTDADDSGGWATLHFERDWPSE